MSYKLLLLKFKLKKQKILFFFLLLFSFSAFAQNDVLKTDEEKQAWWNKLTELLKAEFKRHINIEHKTTIEEISHAAVQCFYHALNINT